MLAIIGGDSSIGKALIRSCREANISCSWTSRKAGKFIVDLEEEPTKWNIPPCSVAIICAAITGASCQDKPELSNLVNVTRTKILIEKLISNNVTPVFLSTSQVFSCRELPTEESLTNPITLYGHQKVDVEKAIGQKGIVVRLSKLINPKTSILKRWAADLQAGRVVSAYDNLHLSPISAPYLCKALLKITNERKGIYHISARDAISYFQLAEEMSKQLGGSVVKSHLPIATSKNHRLSVTQTEKKIGLKPPTSISAVKELLNELEFN